MTSCATLRPTGSRSSVCQMRVSTRGWRPRYSACPDSPSSARAACLSHAAYERGRASILRLMPLHPDEVVAIDVHVHPQTEEFIQAMGPRAAQMSAYFGRPVRQPVSFAALADQY